MLHPGLRDGVERFLRSEAMEIRPYMDQLALYSPYRKDNHGRPLPLPEVSVCEVGEAGERAAAEGDDTLDVAGVGGAPDPP